MNDVLKWGAIGLTIWYVAGKMGLLGEAQTVSQPYVGADGVPLAATQPATQATAATNGDAQTAQPVTQPVTVPGATDWRQVPEATLIAAATDALVAAQMPEAVKMNSDQWNWFRDKGGMSIPTVQMFPTGNRNYIMSAAEYHQIMNSGGLSGFNGWYA